MSYQRTTAVALGLALMAVPGAGQDLTQEAVECLPNEANRVVVASASSELSAGDDVRLYFRRLNPNGAYYWTSLNPAADGSYWTTFPKPEQREQRELTDEWWELLQARDWMEGRDREWLEDWLEEQEYEAAEYYFAIFNSSQEEISRTDTMLVPVLDRDDCRPMLDPFQAGQANNLVIGETTGLQAGHEVYHWLCDGIVTRVDFEGIKRADEICRACVVATWLPVVPASAALIAGTTIQKREPRRASEIQPD